MDQKPLPPHRTRRPTPKNQETMTAPKYKSDRTEGRERRPDAVHLKTLCTGCKKPVDCYWPPTTTFGGEPCTAEEYMAKALQSESVGIYCDDCMEKMPDVKLEDLRHE